MKSDHPHGRVLRLLDATGESSSRRLATEGPPCEASVVEGEYFAMTRHLPCIESTILYDQHIEQTPRIENLPLMLTSRSSGSSTGFLAMSSKVAIRHATV